MRILANFSQKCNGDSYSVTFEQTGDVPMESAEETIDELFRLAREAVQRQIDGALPLKVTGAQVPEAEAAMPRVAASRNGSGATDKQKAFLKKLHADKRKGVNIEVLSKAEASQIIKELMEV